jgi:hypothetical protein
MKGRTFGTIRESIHATATGNGSMKTLAAELDWSPSEFSRRTTLGEDNSLTFPADDRLIRIQQLTGDFSVLLTMAEVLGFEVHPRRDHLPEILRGIQETQAALGRQIQQLELTVPLAAMAGPKKAGR